MKDKQNADLYLVKLQNKNIPDYYSFDLFPTAKDAIKSLKIKLTGNYPRGKRKPIWTTPYIKIYKTSKDVFDEDFDENFGKAEEENGIKSWFDISIDVSYLENIVIEELDLGRFILENVQV